MLQTVYSSWNTRQAAHIFTVLTSMRWNTYSFNAQDFIRIEQRHFLEKEKPVFSGIRLCFGSDWTDEGQICHLDNVNREVLTVACHYFFTKVSFWCTQNKITGDACLFVWGIMASVVQGFPLSQSFFRFSYLSQNFPLGNETESQLREFGFTTLVERRLVLLSSLEKYNTETRNHCGWLS